VNNLPLLLDAGIQLILALGLGLIDAIPQLLESLPTVITALITGVVAAIPQLVMAGVKLIVALVKNLPAIISGLIAAVPAIIKGLYNAFTDPKFLKQLGQAGMELIRGLWEGIKGMGDWLWKQVSGFFGDVIDNIRKLLGIHSPSTVFAGFGKNMILGLERGLTGRNNLGSIMDDLSGQVTGGFTLSGSRELALASASSAGGATYVQVTVPLTNSFVGSPDELARHVKGLIVDGYRSGAINLDWTRK
jgi:phage-related protein